MTEYYDDNFGHMECHSIIINTRTSGISMSLFNDIDIAHHVTLDQDLYRWIMRHIVALIYAGAAYCIPSYIAIGSTHFHLVSEE